MTAVSTEVQRGLEECAVQVQCITRHRSFVQKVNTYDRRCKKILNCHPYISQREICTRTEKMIDKLLA